jgi:phenylpropionate dioxygenase-like ring-hydroxylating dioxygenase large terminal subunit
VTSVWERPGYGFRADAVAPLPIEMFGDQSWYAREQYNLLRPGGGLLYVGHDVLLPSKGYRRADGDPRVLLTRDEDGVRAVANLCTHSLRPIASTDEMHDKSCITCPFHQWSFRKDGSLIGGRDINFGRGPETKAQKERLALPRFELISWHGFHFAIDPARRDEYEADFARIDADFAERGLSEHLDFDGWSVLATDDAHYRADWKTFLEVFGDCYHVPPYHEGLASFTDCGTLDWTFGPNFHVQFLDMHADRGGGSPMYATWHDGLERYHRAKGQTMSDFAVAWVGLYPNIMIELYQGLRVLSIVIPTGPDTHINRAHYCVPTDMEMLVPGLPAAMKTAFDETGAEDAVLIESRYEGLCTARDLGLDVVPYHTNLTGLAPEAGTAHFYDWYRREMGLPVTSS